MIINIQNPIDNSIMKWYDNDFTRANEPGPNHQIKQKKCSLKFVLEKGIGVLDIGAHIGDYGICLAHALRNLNRQDIKVYCIEPTKSKCDFMNDVCKLNQLEDYVKVICKGISNDIGNFSITKTGSFSESKCGNNTGAWQWVPDEQGIEFTTLDYLWKSNQIGEIGFFWLDAQWMEKQVLEGGKTFLKHCKPYILMEYMYINKYHDDNYSITESNFGTKNQLLHDPHFKSLFQELNIIISTKKIIYQLKNFGDILLELL